ncbi:MAG TPA: AbrB family transcriptional regulator [Ruminococcaceae bacterium]|nr:AbrB family transcriptional regulator [Oscillospiraceae bacterium]
MEFAYNNLKFFRQKFGYTQEQIAESLDVSRQAVAKWENGSSLPNIDNVIALADLYGISVDMLSRNINAGIPVEEGGKYIFGIVTVGENGEITLPTKACEVFDLSAGDSVLVLGDEDKGMALVKMTDAGVKK